MGFKLLIEFVFISLSVVLVVGNSNGPPVTVSTCSHMRPNSSAPHMLQIGNGSYDFTVNGIGNPTVGYFNYTAGQVYTGSIISISGQNIRGYLVQAVDPSDARIGSFGTDLRQKYLTCSSISSDIADSATLVHNTPNSGSSVSFSWTAPTTGNMVDFRYTIVRSKSEYFGPLSAAASDGIIPIVPTTTMASNGTNSTVPTIMMTSVKIIPNISTTIMASDGVYRTVPTTILFSSDSSSGTMTVANLLMNSVLTVFAVAGLRCF